MAGFVGQITELARRAAIDTLETALARSGTGGGGGGRVSRSSSIAPRAERGRGAKRSSEELSGLSDQFLDYVRANPGMRIEQINKVLNTTTKDLALPIRKLIADGEVSVKGQKRSTTYFAAGRKRGGKA
ncbi:MAG TPA: hypothetical protein VGM88_29280 [Kofleriaceae bacterium]